MNEAPRAIVPASQAGQRSASGGGRRGRELFGRALKNQKVKPARGAAAPLEPEEPAREAIPCLESGSRIDLLA